MFIESYAFASGLRERRIREYSPGSLIVDISCFPPRVSLVMTPFSSSSRYESVCLLFPSPSARHTSAAIEATTIAISCEYAPASEQKTETESPFLFLRVLTGSTPRVSRYPLITPAGGIPARLPRCLCRLYMAYTPHRRAACILPTAGDGAAVNVCPGGCVALYALRLHHIGRSSASPAILCGQAADGNTCRASSAGRVHRIQSTAPPDIRAPLVSVKPRQAVKRAGAGCRVSGAVIL